MSAHGRSGMVRVAWVAVALALLSLACGRSEAPRSAATSDGPGATPDPAPPPPSVPCDGLVTVRLRAVNADGFDDVSVDVAAVAVDGGATVVASGAGGTLDLAPGGAPRVAVVRPAADGSPFHARLVLAGGAAHRTDGGGAMLDAANAPLSVLVDPSKVTPASCHAVIHLDVGGSVAPVRGWRGSAVVPRFSLHY